MATRTKANNTTALNLTGSWDEGIVPTSADDVVWNVNVTAAIGGAVSMGSLTIGVTGAAGISASTTNALSIYGNINGQTATGDFAIACPVVLQAAINITVRNTQTFTISGVISGSFGFNKSWSGTLLLTAANTYSGNNQIYDGILKLQGSAFPTTARTYSTMTSGAVLNIDGATDIGADVTIDGIGILRVTGGNWKQLTNLGLVTISMSAGSLIDIQSGGTLTNGGYAAFVWTNNLATLNVDGTLDMWDGNSIIAGALTGAGSIVKTSFGAGAKTLSIGNCNCNGTFTGTIANTVGTIALTKNGTGTQTLTGINTYTGATTVAAGALMVTGSLASGSAVTVQNSATIGGTGTINGTLTCQAGSSIQPTTSGSTGTLTYSSVTSISLASTTTLKIRATSATMDRLTNSSVSATFSATNVNLVIDVTGLSSTTVPTTTIVSAAKASSGVVGSFASVTVVGGDYVPIVVYNTSTVTLFLAQKLILRKPIERGTVSFAATDTVKPVILVTPLTGDTSKSILLFSSKCNSNATISFVTRGRIMSTSAIQFDRSATPSVAQEVEWQVIEFLQGISVQHVGTTMTSATTNITITEVDLTKSFVVLSHNTTGTGYGGDDLVYGDLTTSTNLALVINSPAVSNNVAAQVVQIYESSVQKLSGTYGTSATKNVTVTTITENKTFWFFGVTTSVIANMKQMPYLSYVDSTTLRFTRADTSTSGNDFVYRLYVVSLVSGVTVQNVATTIAASGSTVTPTITSVNVNNTALNIAGIFQKFATSDVADDDAGYASFALSGLTSTQFTATRAASPAVAATTNVQVLEFVSAVVVSVSRGRLFDICFDTCFEPCMG